MCVCVGSICGGVCVGSKCGGVCVGSKCGGVCGVPVVYWGYIIGILMYPFCTKSYSSLISVLTVSLK